MAALAVLSHTQERENPPSHDEGLPKIVNLAGDTQPRITGLLRQQHLMGRYGLHQSFALIAATLIFGDVA